MTRHFPHLWYIWLIDSSKYHRIFSNQIFQIITSTEFIIKIINLSKLFIPDNLYIFRLKTKLRKKFALKQLYTMSWNSIYEDLLIWQKVCCPTFHKNYQITAWIGIYIEIASKKIDIILRQFCTVDDRVGLFLMNKFKYLWDGKILNTQLRKFVNETSFFAILIII